MIVGALDRLQVFIGYDSREPLAFSVLAHSIYTRASRPVQIVPLVRSSVTQIYARERGPTESTEFSLTRFLVPYLCDYTGTAVFLDCDMLCRVDIHQLYYEAVRQRDKAVLVCQHDYTPKDAVKFLGQPQTAYPRKNWSSVMVFNNAACRALTPGYVSAASGLDLHRFQWLQDEQIGSLPLEWNYLVGEERQTTAPPKLVHFTLGGPWFPEHVDVEYADEWLLERDRMFYGVREMVVA